jgi:hypothetical protein
MLRVETIPCSDEQFAAVRVGANPSVCHPVLDASDDDKPGVIRITAPRRAVSGPTMVAANLWSPPSAYARVVIAGTWHVESAAEAAAMAGQFGESHEHIELVVRDLARPQDAPLVLRPEHLMRHRDRAFREPRRWPNPPEPARPPLPGQAVLTAHGGWFTVDLGPYVATEPNARKTVAIRARWFGWASDEVTVEIAPREGT